MIFNYKIYRGDKNHRHCDAKWLSERQKELVYETTIEAKDGAEATNKLDREINIKTTWHVVRTTISK